jgi:hypothetical protein
MNVDLWVGIAALLVGIGALAVAIYAIADVRHLVRRYVMEAQRDLVFIEAINKLCWEFITPVKAVYSPEMAVLIHKFHHLQQELHPDNTAEISKELIEKEALVAAHKLVTFGGVAWKDVDVDKVQEVLDSWRDGKAKVRIQNMFEGKDHTLL